jgi:uncharacterized protein (TIGR01244 family)
MANYRPIGDGFFIGPQPTAQDLQEAKQQGIKTVIDFRMPSETPRPNDELVKESGLNYGNIPVNKAALSQEQIGKLDEAVKSKEGPYLLHCATGTRAAMLLALSRARQHGWTAERTFEEAERMGYNLKSSPDFAKFVTESVAR